MTREVVEPIANRSPRRRPLFMPWRWGKKGWSAAMVLLIAWLLIYAVSFPPMLVWLHTNAIQPDVLREALWGLYAPLDWLTENSDTCFSLFVWELRLIAESPWLARMLPRPLEQDEIFPWVLNPDGSLLTQPSDPSIPAL